VHPRGARGANAPGRCEARPPFNRAAHRTGLSPDEESHVTRRFQLTFDYLCPFARNANEHVVAALRAGADWDVEFVPFSLAQGHVEADDTAIWDREAPLAESGILALAAGVVVRDEFPAHFLDVHEALFAARHDAGRDIKRREVVAEVLRGAGADAEAVLERVDDGAALKVVREQHEAAAARDVWGVPTFMTDQRSVFVRVLDRPAGDSARATQCIEQIVDLVDGAAMLHEFKQVDLPV
jgi:protein-disulfide isomerase-like protein with CxxC motif